MSPREVAARALGIHPARIESVEAIKHGLTNRSWLVRTAEDAVVVRLSSVDAESLQIDRVAEAQILDAVEGGGIGPQVIACDVTSGLLVTRYIGPTCTDAQLRDPAYIDRIGAVFRKLHRLSPPDGARKVHLPSVIAGYLDALTALRRASALTETHTRERALAVAAEITATSVSCLCHNDVHHLNVVDGGSLRLIDWEYAGVGEPYFDLASLCVYHAYDGERRARLLNAYAGSSDGDAHERLAKCCWLFEYVRDLWTEVRVALDDRP